MLLHFFNPRLVQPHSIMPRYDYLWGETDANGDPIDYKAWRVAYNDYAAGKSVVPPEVPEPAADSEVRALIDFVLNLK
jgi:cytochrome c oxidase cbb3-type subunit 2